MTWLSFCARRPGPEWKTGYGTGDRTLGQIEGVVDHSMEGALAAAYSVLDGSRQSSWTFSIPKSGEPLQHYSLKKIPWHAGLPGDRRQDTSLIGNLTLIGKEHEGVAGEPWTENQLFWSTKIDVACRVLCPSFGANPPTLRKNMWEHRWLSATSCPSDRNPWAEKFTLIEELEDDMVTPEEIQAACERALNAKASEIRTWAKRGAVDATRDILQAVLSIQAGGGLTEAQIEAIIERVLKRQKLVVD